MDWLTTRHIITAWLLLCCIGSASAQSYEPDIDETMRQALRQAMYNTQSFPDRFAEQVWLLDMSSRLAGQIPDEQYRIELLKTIHEEAVRAGLQPELVLAVIQVESNFDRFAISPAGARGLMQVMPFWIKEIGHPDDNLFIPRTNLRYGCIILKYYMDIANNRLNEALARYNGSYGRQTYPNLVLSALRSKWFEQ